MDTTNLFDYLNESTTDIEFSETDITDTSETEISITDIVTEVQITETVITETTIPFLQKPLKDYNNIEVGVSLICIILVAILLTLCFKKF